jgi:2-methylcitrate dehydratase PrpD
VTTDQSRERISDATRALCEWAAATDAAAIPDHVLARAARVLADDLGAIVGARGEPEVQCFHEEVLARTAVNEATVFRGGRSRTERSWAAVANAVAGDWLELDEGYRVTPCHAGLYTVPALLAEAEASNLPFERMLRALVLAYELVTRVARAFTPRAYTMQSHGRYSAIGAAAATALARGADADLLHSAVTAAATLVIASPRNHLVSGALVRNVWPAVGAWSGMLSVDWARCGIGGVSGGLYDVYGTVFGGEAHPGMLTEDLGASWAILDGYTKLYACCQHLHSAVEAVLALRPGLLDRGGASAVEAIEVETHPLALALANPRPETTLGAKFSMPHALSAALVTGTGGADAFMSGTLREPAIGALRERVRVKPYAPLPAPPQDRPARVRVTLRDGSDLSAECLSAAGGPDRPFAPAMLDRKVHALTNAAYPNMAPTILALADAPSARAAGGWADIVARMCT